MSRIIAAVSLAATIIFCSCTKKAELTGPYREEVLALGKLAKITEGDSISDLKRFGPDGEIMLASLLTHHYSGISLGALRELQKIESLNEGIIPYCVAELSVKSAKSYDSRMRQRRFAINTLADHGDKGVQEILKSKTHKKKGFAGVLANIALVQAGHEEAIPALKEGLKDPEMMEEYGKLAVRALCRKPVSPETLEYLNQMLNSYIEKDEYDDPERDAVREFVRQIPAMEMGESQKAETIWRAYNGISITDSIVTPVVELGAPFVKWMVENKRDSIFYYSSLIEKIGSGSAPAAQILIDSLKNAEVSRSSRIISILDSIGTPAAKAYPLIKRGFDNGRSKSYGSAEGLQFYLRAMISVDPASAAKDLLVLVSGDKSPRRKTKEAIIPSIPLFKNRAKQFEPWLISELGSEENNPKTDMLYAIQEVLFEISPDSKAAQKAIVRSMPGYRRFMKERAATSETLLAERQFVFNMTAKERSQMSDNIDLAKRVVNSNITTQKLLSLSADHLNAMHTVVSSSSAYLKLKEPTFIAYLTHYGIDSVENSYDKLRFFGRKTEPAMVELITGDELWEAQLIALEMLLEMPKLSKSSLRAVKNVYKEAVGFNAAAAAAILMKHGLLQDELRPMLREILNAKDDMLEYYALSGLVNEKLNRDVYKKALELFQTDNVELERAAAPILAYREGNLENLAKLAREASSEYLTSNIAKIDIATFLIEVDAADTAGVSKLYYVYDSDDDSPEERYIRETANKCIENLSREQFETFLKTSFSMRWYLQNSMVDYLVKYTPSDKHDVLVSIIETGELKEKLYAVEILNKMNLPQSDPAVQKLRTVAEGSDAKAAYLANAVLN